MTFVAWLRQDKQELLALVEAFEERAALLEFEAGVPRAEAETLAWACALNETPGQPRRTAVPV